MLLTLSVSSSDSISYFLLIATYFHCVLEAILVTICTFFLWQIKPKQAWMQKRLHKRERKGKNVNVIIQGLVFQNKVYLTSRGQCEFLIQFYSSAKGYICLHLSLLVLSHTEIKPNKTLAPVYALLHKKLNPRLTFKPELKSTPFRTTRPRIANMWQLNLLLQEQCRIQGRGPGDPIRFPLPYFG